LKSKFYFLFSEKIMKNFKVRKTKEQKIVWWKFRQYIDFIILWCCLIIALNIHPANTHISNNANSNNNINTKMIYIFHDYKWNEYIMNNEIHWSSSSRDYLFDNEIPDELKWDEKEFINWVSIEDMINKNNDEIQDNNDSTQNNKEYESDSIKNNQISIDNIMSDLWINLENMSWNDNDKENSQESDDLIINVWNWEWNDNNYYTINETHENNNNSLIIKKIWEDSEREDSKNEKNKRIPNNYENLQTAKAFTFVNEWRILPILVSRNDLYFWDTNETIDYIGNYENNPWDYKKNSKNKKSWITIIDEYTDCMTPWGYKISHWDSVLAYKQMDDAPGICNIERRFCWKWKLSWTYTQQWCSINKNYTYEQREWIESSSTSSSKSEEFKWGTKQNKDWSVTVKNTEIWWGFKFDNPSATYSDFNSGDNIRPEDPEVKQTTRPHWNCTTPRGEEVIHGQFIQAFKHANWFNDAPCEMQIRLCSMWELMWTYTESTCKTRDTSFIDRINGSPTRSTYSKEKIDLIKKQMKAEKDYYENTRKNTQRSTDSDALDKILRILDQD